jgi:hypothetical protein
MRARRITASNARRAAHALRLAAFELRAARAVRSGRPVAVVLGNCQAPPVHDLLRASPAFAGEYALVPVTPVHAITAAEVGALQRLLGRTELLLGQPVGPDYRGLELGLEQLAAHAPASCRTIRWPSMFWDAPFPYTVYVRPSPRVHVDAPIITYHDVRVLAAAGAGMNAAQTGALLRDHRPTADGLAGVRDDMWRTYGSFDRFSDIPMLDWIQRPEHFASAFWTINHPARFVLVELVRRIHALLGLPYAPGEGREPLGNPITPIDAAVLGDHPSPPRPAWVVDGETIPWERLIASHLSWYAARPDVVAAGIAEHAGRRAWLGLP